MRRRRRFGSASISSGSFAAALAVVAVLAAACGGAADPPAADRVAPATGTTTAASREDDLFVDVAAEVGVDFVHRNGSSGEYYFHEMMGAGAALFDYDRDGDLDLYLVQGHRLPAAGVQESGAEDSSSGDSSSVDKRADLDRLYRNELTESGSLRFVDVTEESGLRASGYGMGVAAGDLDNDGFPDLYVTNFEANQLWRNRGDGTFEERTEEAGVAERRWSVSAVVFDYDRDGWLDLYVGNYVDFSIAIHQPCRNELGGTNYCGPLAFRPLADVVFRNRGDGTFENDTAAAGLGTADGAALGAIPADFDGDGWLDLYVANDGTANRLWRNLAGRGFRDEALLAGAAVNLHGQPEGSMGIDAADFDGDGDEDLFMTHIRQETNTLYLNDGDGMFEDASDRSLLGAPSLERTGFGTAFFDYDNDGVLDLLAVNGAVRITAERALEEGDPLAEPNQLFRGTGRGFVDVSSRAGEALQRSETSRGAAFGDLDNDGDVDVVVNNNGGPVRVLINRSGQDQGFVGLRLLDPSSGRDLLGAWVGLFADGRTPLWRRSRTAGSYASANDPRVLFGLGPQPPAEVTIRVRWPDLAGPEWEEFAGVETGRYVALERGDGAPVR